MTVQGALDSFSVLPGAVLLRGWCHAAGQGISGLELLPADFPQWGAPRPVSPMWLPSLDVAAALGPNAAACRFDILVYIGPHAGSMCGGRLLAVLEDGSRSVFATMGDFKTSASTDVVERFFALLDAMAAPAVLEVGSRARSGITRRDRIPPGASYTGCDILPGDNVDVVCDAHALSSALPKRGFDAMFCMSVIEHLLMPWKFAVELNRVLRPGAICLITTHQCWPMHDEPWDFWRFSDRAWAGLFNKATGFEVIATGMGEPAYIVAEHCHPVTNFAPRPAGFLASNVLFRKVGETELDWQVDLAGLVEAAYPA